MQLSASKKTTVKTLSFLQKYDPEGITEDFFEEVEVRSVLEAKYLINMIGKNKKLENKEYLKEQVIKRMQVDFQNDKEYKEFGDFIEKATVSHIKDHPKDKKFIQAIIYNGYKKLRETERSYKRKNRPPIENSDFQCIIPSINTHNYKHENFTNEYLKKSVTRLENLAKKHGVPLERTESQRFIRN